MNVPHGIEKIIESEPSCTINDIFIWPENHEYLCKTTCDVMTNRYHVQRYADELNVTICRDLCGMMLQNIEALVDVVESGIKKYKPPYPEDLPSTDRLYQLHYVNTKFISTMCMNLVAVPSVVIDDYDEIDPIYGEKMRKPSYAQQYSAASFTTGVWDPLEDIKNRHDNKGKSYWEGHRDPFKPVNLDRPNTIKNVSYPRRSATKYRGA